MRYFLPLLWLLFLSAPGTRLSAQSLLSLEECVRIALSEDIGRRVADRQIAIARNNNHGALTGRYPSLVFNINSQGSLTNQQNPASFLNGLIRSGNLAFSLDASWVVFEGFRARFSQQRLGKLEEQSRVGLLDASLETVRRVTLAYLLAEWQQAQVELAAEVLRLSREVADNQEQRREFGQALRQQVLQSRDAVLSDSSSLLLARLNLQTALLQLHLAMGQPDREAFRVGGTLGVRPGEMRAEALNARMLASHPALMEARLNREINRLQTDIRRAAWYPRIALSTGAVWSGNVVGLDGNNPFTGEPFGLRTGTNRNVYAGVLLSLPLFDAGLRHRQVQEARIFEEVAALSETAISRDLRTRLLTLSETARAQQELLELSLAQEENARENLGISAERYRFGQMSIFDYRAVQLAFSQAVQRRLTNLYNLKVTEVEILTLTGELVR
jgi:outer membrane protein